MAGKSNHKTVFIMDHGPNFAVPCDTIELDLKSSASHGVSIINKTIWTSATESVLEYARVVYDIFPPDTDDVKLIRMVLAQPDDGSEVLNSWQPVDQSIAAISAGLALVGPPTYRASSARGKEHSLRQALLRAVQSLVELTPQQKRIAEKSQSLSRVQNQGRIVLLTHVTDREKLKDLFFEIFVGANKRVTASASQLPISSVEFDVVHCFPPKNFDNQKSIEKSWADPINGIGMNIFAVAAGADLSKKLLCLALRHYDLASTTVTGIPMKEEQNASSSANYDVELFHKASAHTKLFSVDGYSATAPVDLQSWMPQTIKEGCEYKTVTLKWCTPRGASGPELQHCISASRITPTDVNSRPSSCLTNFLLAGRSVMLEMPRRSGTKILSHMLTSHAGEIFIHTLGIARSVIEDPPSISEGPGGRVTDYRITDLGEMMKQNQLAPFFGESKPGIADPIDKACQRLSRFATFCPMTISGTTILNMAAVMPIYNIMLKEELTEENLAECRKVIYNLLSMENKGDPLPVPVQPALKSKTPKKDEQYKIMFAELERFLSAHCRTDRHNKVLDCLLEVRNRTPVRKDSDKVDLDVALKEIERYSMSDKRSSEFDEPGSRSRSQTPPPPLKRPKIGGQNLLQIFMGRIEKENSKMGVPFAGMRSVGEKAKLYLSLERKEKDGTPTPMDL